MAETYCRFIKGNNDGSNIPVPSKKELQFFLGEDNILRTKDSTKKVSFVKDVKDIKIKSFGSTSIQHHYIIGKNDGSNIIKPSGGGVQIFTGEDKVVRYKDSLGFVGVLKDTIKAEEEVVVEIKAEEVVATNTAYGSSSAEEVVAIVEEMVAVVEEEVKVEEVIEEKIEEKVEEVAAETKSKKKKKFFSK